MKAVSVFPARKQMALTDEAEPRLVQDTAVKIRMLEVGVCGTDREIAAFDYGTAPTGSDHFIVGHESFGEVVEAGGRVSHLNPGDLVVLTVRRPCPENCPACAAGRQDFCYTGNYRERGIVGANGYMTEFVVEDAEYAHLVPSHLRAQAVLTEPLTIAEKSFAQAQIIRERTQPWGDWRQQLALVLGAGPVGLLGAMKAILLGYRTFIYSLGRDDQRKQSIIRAIGATFIPAEDVRPDQVHEHCPDQIDLVYEAVGVVEVAVAVLEQLGRNGVFVFTGVPAQHQPVPTNTHELARRLVLQNQVVLGSVNASPHDFQQAIADLGELERRFPGLAAQLITARYPIERFAEPIQHADGIKNVIAVGG